jgi:hypothetical protein
MLEGRELEVEGGRGLDRTLRMVEAKIRNLDYERGYIITPEGRIREEVEGTQTHVWLGLGAMQAGEVSVHNHPREGWHCPSPVDWEVMIACPVGEMRVVSEHWTYSLRAPAGGWPLNYRFRRYWTGEKMRFGLNLKEMVGAVGRRIEEQMPHWYDAERRRSEGSEMMHQAWQVIAQEVGASYSREPAWETILGEVSAE